MALTHSSAKAAAARQENVTDGVSVGHQYAGRVAEEDQLLIEALQRNDREAFGAFVQRHQGFVYGYLRTRLADVSDADDLCQEVFLRCLCGKVKFRGDVPIRPWILGVTRNVLREHVRRNHRRKEVEWTELCLELDSLSRDDSEDYLAVHQWLLACMDSLGKSAHDALKMHYYARMKMAEIAVKMRRSEGAVKLLVFRARQALKDCVTRKSRMSSHE